jgi:hypothetical protein
LAGGFDELQAAKTATPKRIPRELLTLLI